MYGMEIQPIDWSVWDKDLSTIARGGRRRGRGKRSAAIRAPAWESHREEIRELYETKPLEKVQALMRQRYGFAPTLSQYKRQLTIWGVAKNRRASSEEEKSQSSESTRMTERNEVFKDTWLRFALISLVGCYKPSGYD